MRPVDALRRIPETLTRFVAAQTSTTFADTVTPSGLEARTLPTTFSEPFTPTVLFDGDVERPTEDQLRETAEEVMPPIEAQNLRRALSTGFAGEFTP